MINNHLKQTSISALSLLIVGGILYGGLHANLPSQAEGPKKNIFSALKFPEVSDITDPSRDLNTRNIKTAPFIGASMDLPDGVEAITFFVSDVIDGNTIIADGDKRVRLVGIKSPDKDEEYGVEATDFLRQIVGNQEIVFQPDKDNPKDDFGRLRGVVYRDGSNVNIEILRAGLAHIYPSYPSSISYDDWQAYEDEAREARRGLWGNKLYFNRFIDKKIELPEL